MVSLNRLGFRIYKPNKPFSSKLLLVIVLHHSNSSPNKMQVMNYFPLWLFSKHLKIQTASLAHELSTQKSRQQSGIHKFRSLLAPNICARLLLTKIEVLKGKGDVTPNWMGFTQMRFRTPLLTLWNHRQEAKHFRYYSLESTEGRTQGMVTTGGRTAF